MHAGRRKGQSSIGAAAVMVAALVTACAGPSPSPSPSVVEPAIWPSDSVYGRLFARVGEDGAVDLDTALQAFTLAIAPLPGVAPPDGPAPALAERADGTFAIDWLLEHAGELTAEQTAAFDAAIAVPDDALTVPLESPVSRVVAGALFAAETTDPETSQYLNVLASARAIYARRLGRSLSVPVKLVINEVAQQSPSPLGYRALAYSVPIINRFGGAYDSCGVFVEPSGREADVLTITASLAHEMFHCYQFDIAPGHRTTGIPDWIVEGQAEWAGEAAMGASPTGAFWWGAYLTSTRAHLFQRDYDAVGFYEHLVEVGIDPWTKLDAMLLAGGSINAFKAADAVEDKFLDTWASGLYRDLSLPNTWYATGRWSTGARDKPVDVQVNGGTREPIEVDAGTNWDYHVLAATDVIEVSVNGHARVSTRGSDVVGVADTYFCTRVSGCACPPGTSFDGPPLVDAGAEIALAVTGSLDGASGTILGHELDDYCLPDQGPGDGGGGVGPTGGPDPCDEGCGESVGDTHLTTIDGGRYDFQAAGEYTMLRSADGKIEIQARLRRYADSDQVSVESALAFLVNGHRVSVYETTIGGVSGAITLHVDGAEVPITSGIDLGNGGQVATMSKGIEVAWPDGTLAWVLTIGAGELGIDLQVAPSAVLRSGSTGLLAPIAAGSDLPALADGSTLPGATEHDTRFDQVYHRLGPSWHVTDATSLFDYAAGESTATFDIAGLPSPDTPQDVEEFKLSVPVDTIEQADRTCAAVAGNEREHLHCVFDVLATEDPAWAAFYQFVAQFLDRGPDALHGDVTPPAGIARLPDVESSGIVLLPNGTLAAAVSHAAGTSELLMLDPVSGEIRQRTPTAGSVAIGFAAGSLWITSGTATTDACAVDRLDPATLAKQATVSVPCGPFGTSFVTTADALWGSDGTALRRIDPAALTLGAAIALPVPDGELLAGDSAIFNGDDPPAHWFKLDASATTFVDLGELTNGKVVVDDALWTDDFDGARRYRAAGGPEVTIPLDGVFVSADFDAAYAARNDQASAHSELWRYPVAGSAPHLVAANDVQLPGIIGTFQLNYVDATILVGNAQLTAVWLTRSSLDEPAVMYVQSVSVP